MAAQQPARASPELRVAPLSPHYRRNYTTPKGHYLLKMSTINAGHLSTSFMARQSSEAGRLRTIPLR